MLVADLCQSFFKNHSGDAARLLERRLPPGLDELMHELSPAAVAPVVGQMNPVAAAALLEGLSAETQVEIFGLMYAHRASALLRRMEANEREQLLARMPAEGAAVHRRMLQYPDNSAGALMDPHYPCLAEDLRVGDALERVRSDASQTAMYWFTIDRDQGLTGMVSLRSLLSPNVDQALVQVRQPCKCRVSANGEISELFSSPEVFRQGAVPVVDERNSYLGAVRLDVLMARDAAGLKADSLQSAGSALGELYRLGLLGLFYSMDTGSKTNPASKETTQ